MSKYPAGGLMFMFDTAVWTASQGSRRFLLGHSWYFALPSVV